MLEVICCIDNDSNAPTPYTYTHHLLTNKLHSSTTQYTYTSLLSPATHSYISDAYCHCSFICKDLEHHINAMMPKLKRCAHKNP